MKLYGHVSIVQGANGPRITLNVKGRGAPNIQTFKPNGEAWDFNRRSARNDARALINSMQPTWLVGSPP